ncbi:hypothetical protein KEM60_02725 [Austwickia sp. TVS 96-490-7B]|uniref:DUF4233 domain-containing protein n=1 Tax=Austwickia sp. TVS 96-490-7B TaxID=2830843 RepID=UPI001D4530EF|nr:DUF4233 domain-containing protein [Austwickia sp. TVS 96-490-7B]MBW3086504.1 hypothetical protein [Austwickia sp. TVS 96-490-7B]
MTPREPSAGHDGAETVEGGRGPLKALRSRAVWPAVYGAQRRMTRRLAMVVLISQSLVVLFGAVAARALAQSSGRTLGPATPQTYLWVGVGLAVALVLGCGLLRRRLGVTFGWMLQLATLLCGLVIPAMAVIALIFAGLWWIALVQGSRLDDMSEAYAREHLQEG